MAKKSKKRLGRYDKDQSGCMWSLINIFDFRHARSSQKLLTDRKRGSKRIIGATYPDIKLESLSESCEVCKEPTDVVQSETPTTDTSKMSVKELMAEEMCVDKFQKTHDSTNNGDAKQMLADEGGQRKKNRRRTRSKTSLDFDFGGFVKAQELVAEKPSHRKHKSASSIDLNVMVEELCSRIHQNPELSILPINEDPSVLEEKLGEATKVLVNHFADGKGFPKDGKIHPSKELVGALQILDSNKEVFLKLLQDPNSQLVKHIRSLQDIQVEEGKFKVLTGSNLLEEDPSNGKQGFFRRRFKGLERNLSRKSDTSEELNRIVVLKPGPPGSRNLDRNAPCESLPESPQTETEKSFSFSEFKKKLKHAMKKEQPNFANQDRKAGGETVGMTSPGRDRFFIERIPKSSISPRKVEHDTTLTPEQRVSNIYAEAKKHLAEIVGNSDVDGDNRDRQKPKSLGRILSYAGYSSPTICSPRIEGPIRLPSDGECQSDNKTCQAIQENNIRPPGEVKEEPESKLGLGFDEPIYEAEGPSTEPRNLDGLSCEAGVDKPTHQYGASGTQADSDIKSPDSKPKKESKTMEIALEPCLLQPISTSEQVDNSASAKCSEDCHSTSLRQDTPDENEPSTSPISSTRTCSITDKNEDQDAVSDATSRPSPISVLDPLFKEDVVSPPGIKSITALQPIQPRQIKFEEEISSVPQRLPSLRNCMDRDKYTFEFVKAVVQMSGLTWDELLTRSLLSDHLIDPSLIDEVDFLPDLLSCDFNLLFDLIGEVLIEICGSSFGSMLLLAKPLVHPGLKGKDLFSEIWRGVDWYLKLDGPPRSLDQIIAKDLAKATIWMDLMPDSETVGIQVQEAILEELIEDAVSILEIESLEREIFTFLPAESEIRQSV